MFTSTETMNGILIECVYLEYDKNRLEGYFEKMLNNHAFLNRRFPHALKSDPDSGLQDAVKGTSNFCNVFVPDRSE